ncbi:MAG: RNase adapter RapZ [Erysipelotrichaceae bacterium]|nr:RNase adapter RapZ [Erysipelotrichaceae bacterium]
MEVDRYEVVVVTGMSGAGKTSAMEAFETMAYRCIDNYPVALLPEFGEYLKNQPTTGKVALAIQIEEVQQAIMILENMEWLHVSVLFLDCSNEVLIKRYKESRRIHPLMISNKVSSLLDAITVEREDSNQVVKLANYIIDTTNLKKPKFQNILMEYYDQEKSRGMTITFESFGYKNGVPRDCDLLFDVRFLPNPFYIDELRPLTGNNKEVYDYVITKNETQIFIERLKQLLDYLLEQYVLEGKQHLTIGIECTGGQHRSVTLANYFADYYKGKYRVYRFHRDAFDG